MNLKGKAMAKKIGTNVKPVKPPRGYKGNTPASGAAAVRRGGGNGT